MANNETPRTIPKFDGALPTASTYKTWLKAATTYFGGNTDNVDKGRIEGLACLAFKDTALEWFVEEMELNDAFPETWAAFSEKFTERFGPTSLAQSDKAAILASTKMGQNEHVLRFKTRCLTAARLCTYKIPAPPNEGEAAKTTRKELQTKIIQEQAMWLFLQGVLPVIREELLQCDFDDFDSCVKKAVRTITLLVDRGKYRDPARPTPAMPGPRDPSSKHKNVEMLNSTIAALEGQIAELRAGGQAAAAVNARGRGQGRGRGRGRGKGKRDPANYTPNATCTYCSKPGHVEEQCYSKKNAAKNANISAVNNEYDSLPTSQCFWEGAGM